MMPNETVDHPNDLLRVRGLSKTFGARGRSPVHALTSVDLTVRAGSVTGLVGESGSGKSTLLRCIMGLEQPDAGTVTFAGTEMISAGREDWKRFRQSVQLVFQDPFSSLDPRMTVERIVGEGLVIHGKANQRLDRRMYVAEALQSVGLAAEDMQRYPRSFSGGQRQRIAIARAIVMKPRLLVCDEPVSALDVSVQAQVINLLMAMRAELGLSILFIAHDLAVVRHLCDSIAVLQNGVIVEDGTTEQVFDRPQDPYTRDLLAASPIPDPAAQRARRAARR